MNWKRINQARMSRLLDKTLYTCTIYEKTNAKYTRFFLVHHVVTPKGMYHCSPGYTVPHRTHDTDAGTQVLISVIHGTPWESRQISSDPSDPLVIQQIPPISV